MINYDQLGSIRIIFLDSRRKQNMFLETYLSLPHGTNRI